MLSLDGITVMKKLKSIRSFNTKVVLLTRNNDYEYNDDYLKYGFYDYILKLNNKFHLHSNTPLFHSDNILFDDSIPFLLIDYNS